MPGGKPGLHSIKCWGLGLKRRVQDLEVKNESAEEFSREKPQKIIVSGASHLKSISQGKLINTTGKTIEFLRTYCSRDDWPWAWKPDVSIASVLLQQVHSRATHLVMTSPTSDITNLGKLDPAIRLHWIDPPRPSSALLRCV